MLSILRSAPHHLGGITENKVDKVLGLLGDKLAAKFIHLIDAVTELILCHLIRHTSPLLHSGRAIDKRIDLFRRRNVKLSQRHREPDLVVERHQTLKRNIVLINGMEHQRAKTHHLAVEVLVNARKHHRGVVEAVGQ